MPRAPYSSGQPPTAGSKDPTARTPDSRHTPFTAVAARAGPAWGRPWTAAAQGSPVRNTRTAPCTRSQRAVPNSEAGKRGQDQQRDGDRHAAHTEGEDAGPARSRRQPSGRKSARACARRSRRARTGPPHPPARRGPHQWDPPQAQERVAPRRAKERHSRPKQKDVRSRRPPPPSQSEAQNRPSARAAKQSRP